MLEEHLHFGFLFWLSKGRLSFRVLSQPKNEREKVGVPTYNSRSLANFSTLKRSVTIRIPLNEEIAIPKANQEEMARVGATGRFKVFTPCVKKNPDIFSTMVHFCPPDVTRRSIMVYVLAIYCHVSPGPNETKKGLEMSMTLTTNTHATRKVGKPRYGKQLRYLTALRQGGGIESSSTLRGHRGPSAATRV